MNCYLLAGGESRRMGRSKVELFAPATITTARAAFDDVLVVQRPGGALLEGLQTIEDAVSKTTSGAAILGVLAALRHADGRCFVLAVDYPLLTADLLRFLRARFERSGAALLVPEWQGEPQLLCAGYGSEILPVVEAHVAAERFALRPLLDAPGAEIIPERELRGRFPGEPLMNVNTPADLRAAEKRTSMANRDFSHLDETGGISMVHVGAKKSSQREAVAVATVRMTRETLEKLVEQALPKGDVLTTAKVAGVLAAKQTPNLIPLAHPIPLDSVDITFDIDRANGTIEVRSIVRCEGKTGVEMEAMTACAVASLTIYDMCKSAEKGITIDALQLVRKSGGKSGVWER